MYVCMYVCVCKENSTSELTRSVIQLTYLNSNPRYGKSANKQSQLKKLPTVFESGMTAAQSIALMEEVTRKDVAGGDVDDDDDDDDDDVDVDDNGDDGDEGDDDDGGAGG